MYIIHIFYMYTYIYICIYIYKQPNDSILWMNLDDNGYIIPIKEASWKSDRRILVGAGGTTSK